MSLPSEFFTRDPNEFLRPPEKHTLVSLEVDGSFVVVEYHGELEDGRKSRVKIVLNDHGQEVIRTVKLFLPTPPEPEPISPPAWYERLWLYIAVKILGR
jgi:hypothetical protein